MKTKFIFLAACVIAAFSFLLVACSRTESNGKARMQIFLTDDPGDYEAVFIDVQGIRINYTSDTASGWKTLPNIATGQYDLLTLVNDKDTLLADASINTGRVEQIRLILGTENYVKVDGKLIKLDVPSGQQSGLKLNIHQDVSDGVLYKLIMDFDVAKSIRKTGNGKYMLKPVIRTVLESLGGSIKGYVLPDTFQTSVLAIQGTDTAASTYSNGGFLIKGLSSGTYSLHFIPTNSTYQKKVLDNVNVVNNSVTTVDTVRLQQ